MTQKIEKSLSKLIGIIINKFESGVDIYDSEELREALSLFETFISLELRKKYDDWEYESLDGIYEGQILMTGKNKISIIGMCVLVSDQSYIPIYINIEISDSTDEIVWMDCKLAELGQNGIIKIPYNSNRWNKQMYALDVNTIAWYYSISYGKET
ncbi:hypothetical protein [Pseudobacteroides cellulosolvens]|uniref:Uncharacterized protein n=1 Tax=Pseudobacteroides cellulosolvens ATCC 35603 = DSM 2933 TaxID=398512 RepID=A0A0L6JJD7_9FIRM|nr:hypothetical protein [Pseudobacteroides cellulosolvens]KNY25864.1 hypothetical protein Bccel_1124 [Pseudobacteroides cellulosolvens ATCC 35603 = DSM 2933]